MGFWGKLFGTGAIAPVAEQQREAPQASGEALVIACPSCKHMNVRSRGTPAFGTAVICSQCKASLIRAGNLNERPYVPPREVALFLGYQGCSLIHARCPSCREVNYSVVVPERGHSTSFYWNREQENPSAAFVVNASCPHCSKPYVIEWDEDPR